MIEIQAPNSIDVLSTKPKKSIFLAGSIDMGQAIEWQQQVVDALQDKDLYVLNPRRNDWDSSWKEDINNQKFKEQVEWELDAMEKCTLILLNFDKDSKAPISLLELGLFARKDKIVCVCAEGYWKKGNVDIVCQKYNIAQAKSLEAFVKIIQLSV